MSKRLGFINILLISTLIFTSVAMAQESDPAGIVTLTGTIGGIGEGFIEFIIDQGDSFRTYKVYPVEPVDMQDLPVGAIIVVSGYYNGEDLIAASDIQLQASELDSLPQTADIYSERPAFCDPNGSAHPIAAGIAETYSVEYDTITNWVCEQAFSFGEIIVALQTADITGGDPEGLIKEKNENGGWGHVWVSHGLISNEQLASAPIHPGKSDQTASEDGKLPQDKANPPDHAKVPGGPGDDFIPPGQDKDKDKDKDKELPDNAGPPDGSGPPGQLKAKENKDKPNKGN